MGGKRLGLLGLRDNGDKCVKARGGCSPLLRLTDSKACVRVCVHVHVWTDSCSTEGCVYLYTFPWSFSHKETANHRRKKGLARQTRAAPCRWAQLRTCGSAGLLPAAHSPLHFSVCFSLLREHSIDGTGWAPTRTLKVKCGLLPGASPSGSQPPRRTAVCTLSRPHRWPPTPLPLPSAPAGPPGAAGQGWVRLVPLPSATGAAVVYCSCSSCCSPGLHSGLP